jgi:signal transduction histidine kinase
MGIGLAVCAQIIHLHGGSIVVQSQPGEGSTFTIGLPIYQEG